MKKITIGVALLVAGAILGVAFVGIPVGAGTPPPVTTGDTNGDGSIDIADAIRILVHLFGDGPPPVVCADSPELLQRVASLEARMAQTESTLDVVASGDFALWIDRVSFRVVGDCPNGRGSSDGPGVFKFFPWFLMRKGELIGEGELTGSVTADEIAFTTNREADLAITYTWTHNDGMLHPAAGVQFWLDDRHINSFGTISMPETQTLYVPDVPAGEHRFSLQGTCITQGLHYDRAFVVEFLRIEYLE